MNSLIQKVYFSNDSFNISKHYHDSHQILLVTRGTVQVTINDKTFRARAGNLVFLDRLSQHSISASSRDYARYVLRVNPYQIMNFEAINQNISILFFNMLRNCEIIDILSGMQELKDIFDRMIFEKESNSELCDTMLELLFSQLLILIYRFSPDTIDFYDSDFEFVRKIQQHLESNPQKQYSLTDLARKYQSSSSSLSHKFKKVTGVSVMEYIKACRMAVAKNYLTHSTMSITEIVESCGFSDFSNFSRSFKKTTGISRSKFRQLYSAKSKK